MIKTFRLKLFWELFFIASLTILSIMILPYQFGVEDQVIYIPIIEKQLNPSLFENDYLLKHHQQTTLFFPLVTFLIKIVGNMETVFFILYFLSSYLTFLGIYYLSKKIFNNHLMALVSVALFFFPKWVGGTGVFTYENYFLPRFFATPLVIFSLYLIYNQRWLLGALITSLTFLIHPVSAAPIFLIYTGFMLINRKKITNINAIFSLLALIIPSLLLFLVAKKEFIQATNYLIMPQDWLNISKSRDFFVFPQLWKLRSFGSIFIFYFFYIIFLSRNSFIKMQQKIKKESLLFINLIFLATLSLPLFTIIISETIPITFLIQLELARSLTIFTYISLMCLAYFVVSIFDSHLHLIIKTITMFIFLFVIFWNNTLIKQVDLDWKDIQVWAKNNTSENSIFLTDPYKKGFRVFSNRAIVGEYKDGGPVLFSYEFAKEWDKRMADLNDFNKFQQSDFKKLKDKYIYQYLVIEKGRYLNFTKLYENEKYAIYYLP